MDLSPERLTEWVIAMLVLIIAITIHEFAHALTADRLGDGTPRAQGRISLNPVDHLETTGTIMMAVSTFVGFGLGWGRPVQYNPTALRHPRRDTILIALAGPASNFLQACVFAALLRSSRHYGWFADSQYGPTFLLMGVTINLALVFFNLIPIPPLDGSKILFGLLPAGQARGYERVMAQWGLPLFLLLVFTRITSLIIGPPVAATAGLLLGQ
jgi:Zn-dependent protease